MAEKRPKTALEDLAILHTPLLALCPLLGLFAYNIEKVRFAVLVRPAFVLLIAAEGLLLALWLVYRDKYKAGIVASWLVVAATWGWSLLETGLAQAVPILRGGSTWVAYGVFAVALIVGAVAALVAWKPKPSKAIRYGIAAAVGVLAAALVIELGLTRIFGRVASWCFVGYAVATLCLARWLGRLDQDYRALTRSANWFAMVLIGLYAALTAFNYPREPIVPPPALEFDGASEAPAGETPDIYLIVLDGYARSDVLARTYAYNDQPFLDSMDALGMREAPEAYANYPWALQSMASCLNMEYLDALLPAEYADSAGFTTVASLYHNNRFFAFLKSRGYTVTAFSPGVQLHEPRSGVDTCLAPPRAMNELEVVLLDRTVGARVMQVLYRLRGRPAGAWRMAFRRKRVEYTFRRLPELAGEESAEPRLVYAHLVVPGPDFFFSRDGGWVDPDYGVDVSALYRDQLHFTNKLLYEAIAGIRERAKKPHAIIVLSSHGPGLHAASGESGDPDLKERYGTLVLTRFPRGPGWRGIARTRGRAVLGQCSACRRQSAFRNGLAHASRQGIHHTDGPPAAREAGAGAVSSGIITGQPGLTNLEEPCALLLGRA